MTDKPEQRSRRRSRGGRRSPLRAGREESVHEVIRPVRADARDKLSAIVHADGSTRVHTVSKEANPLFHTLLLEFEKLKGVPVLRNTSFNVNREPIVNTPVEAIRCFFSTGLDYLVMGRYLVGKEEEDLRPGSLMRPATGGFMEVPSLDPDERRPGRSGGG